MTDATESKEVIEDTQEEQVIDYKALYEKTKMDLAAVVTKKDELLTETKKAKEARREADESAKKSAEDKAMKDGEFEKLWQNAQKEKEELNKKLMDTLNLHKADKINVQSMRIANDLADGDNAELLSTFVREKLKTMADESGSVTSDIIDAIKNDFKNSSKYRALLRSSKAAGGGATGNMGSAQQSTQVDRATFERIPFDKRVEFLKTHVVVDQL